MTDRIDIRMMAALRGDAPDDRGGALLPDLTDRNEMRATRSSRIVWLVGIFMVVFFAWAWFFEIDEVSSGTGRVIPSSHEQVIQSLEGGILSRLNVREGQIVERGAVLAQLDPTRGETSVEETAARYRAALAASARLQAEVEGRSTIAYPPNWINGRNSRHPRRPFSGRVVPTLTKRSAALIRH